MVANEYRQFYCLMGPEHLQCGPWNVLRTLMTKAFSSLKCFMRKISLILIRKKKCLLDVTRILEANWVYNTMRKAFNKQLTMKLQK